MAGGNRHGWTCATRCPPHSKVSSVVHGDLAASITIHAVQFVGTNVEMTYTVDPSWTPAAGSVEAALEAMLGERLRLHAVTATGDLGGHPRFSVMASPLERLFHKIGPAVPLTIIKHASVTLDLSDVNLERQALGLLRTYPEQEDTDEEIWTPWDTGKLIGILLRRPSLARAGSVEVAGVRLGEGAFPNGVLPTVTHEVERSGGVRVRLADEERAALRRMAPAA